MVTVRLAFFVFVLLCNFLDNSSCGPHTHKTENRENEDVTFSPRNQNHYANGEHRSEFDHEAVLGSHDVAEEFDHLPPEEAKMRLKVLALKMDRNHDGYVDKKELTEWVLRSFRMLTEEEAMDQLEDEDGDNDGKITWQEHMAETYGLYDDDLIPALTGERSDEYQCIMTKMYDMDDLPQFELCHQNMENNNRRKKYLHRGYYAYTKIKLNQMIQNDDQLFKAADLNGDGILDKSEFPAFSHPEEFEHMHQVVYEQAMEKRDKDKDGFLSLEEFVADNHGNVPIPSTEHYISEKDRFVHDYDQDKDGKLNREEVMLWLIPNNLEMAETEAEHLIESSDTDKDGRLSIEEIVDHHDVFVGSEATDFGEHLHNTHKFNDEL